MSPKLEQIVRDVEEARTDGSVCRDCLVDVVLTALDRVLEELPEDARHVAAATLEAKYAVAN